VAAFEFAGLRPGTVLRGALPPVVISFGALPLVLPFGLSVCCAKDQRQLPTESLLRTSHYG
jgi:hypothetical protein